MVAQLSAMKDIIDEAGTGLFNQEEVTTLSQACISMVNKSLERIEETKKNKKEAEEDEDNEDFDDDDAEVYKDEMKSEYELQLSIAEVVGILMKTHASLVAELVGELQSKVIPFAFQSGEQKRQKFALFILDDIVEHLGPSYFSESDFMIIAQTICQYVTSPSMSLRQAAAYGVGSMAQHTGEAFCKICDGAMQALN